MTAKQALAEAKRRFGPKGYARTNRHVTWKEADRNSARAALKSLRGNKPVRTEGASEDEKRDYLLRFRAWRKLEEELMTVALSHRCDVGTLSDEIGFAIFGIRGSGDTYEAAFAEVDRKAND